MYFSFNLLAEPLTNESFQFSSHWFDPAWAAWRGVPCLLFSRVPHCPTRTVSTSTAADLGSLPAFTMDFIPGPVIPVTETSGTPVATLPGA